MARHVVAYPDMAQADMERIQLIRKEHNSLYTIIDAHFTIVFSVTDMTDEEFIAEIKKQLGDTKAIPFTLRCAVINKDSFSKNYDAFLVPDEGFGNISKLHDRLYAGKLAPHHRLDVSYIPHISVANSPDPMKIKGIVDELNKEELAIKGTISALQVIDYANRAVTVLEEISLPWE